MSHNKARFDQEVLALINAEAEFIAICDDLKMRSLEEEGVFEEKKKK